MGFDLVEGIANAVLYEGYLLYPYRATSLKNRMRWTLGGLYPEAYARSRGSGDRWRMQAECLVRGGVDAVVQARIKFLHLVERTVEHLESDGSFSPVESLAVDGAILRPWQEAVERAVDLPALAVADLTSTPLSSCCDLPPSCVTESVVSSQSSEPVGRLVRRQESLQGKVRACADRLDGDLFRLHVELVNCTPYDSSTTRQGDALLSSFVAAHVLLEVSGAEFVSMIDDDPRFEVPLRGCTNDGTWPVLVGSASSRSMMLSAPIILPDYPEIASESPGDLFDATEIDEILSLRILTMTAAEKVEMAAGDPRARDLLARTESLLGDDLMRMHGVLRQPRGVDG